MKTAYPILLALLLAALAQPAIAHHTPSHNQCAPVFYDFFPVGFYDLLNDPDFSGTYPSCTGWNNFPTIVTSSACWNSNAAVLTSGSLAFGQNFFVPSDTSGYLELGVEFAIIGTPVSTSDRLVFYLRDQFGNLLEPPFTIYTKDGPYACHRISYTFDNSNYAGRNLFVSVRAPYVSSGVSYHINSFQVVAYRAQ